MMVKCYPKANELSVGIRLSGVTLPVVSVHNPPIDPLCLCRFVYPR